MHFYLRSRLSKSRAAKYGVSSFMFSGFVSGSSSKGKVAMLESVAPKKVEWTVAAKCR